MVHSAWVQVIVHIKDSDPYKLARTTFASASLPQHRTPKDYITRLMVTKKLYEWIPYLNVNDVPKINAKVGVWDKTLIKVPRVYFLSFRKYLCDIDFGDIGDID